MVKPKVSIIVPVYNVEKYIDKCLDSLVNQTLKDIEIIVINDGTKDNSQQIIDKYVKKYPFVKSFIKENGGMSSARNYGLKYAKGEYIAFVDSDDYVELDMYEKMYQKAKSNDFDVVVCNIKYIYPSSEKCVSSNINSDLFTKEDIKKSMLVFYPSVWNKIYHNRVFKKNIKFKENAWYEDVEFLYKLYPYINSIGVVNKYCYNYVRREGTITSTFNERVFDYISNWNGIIKYYKDNNLYNEYKKELEYCYVRYIYATFIKTATKISDKQVYYKAIDEAIKGVKNNFPKYRKNRYFYKNLKGIYLVIFNKFLAKLMYKGSK